MYKITVLGLNLTLTFLIIAFFVLPIALIIYSSNFHFHMMIAVLFYLASVGVWLLRIIGENGVMIELDTVKSGEKIIKVLDIIYLIPAKDNIRILSINIGGREYWQSGLNLKHRKAIFSVHKCFWFVEFTNQANLKRVLVLGGGGCTLPEDIAIHKAGAIIDVVEIDHKILSLAKTYFVSSPHVNIYHDNAENFLQSKDGSYNVIFCDIDTTPLNMPDSFFSDEFWNGLIKNLTNEHNSLFINLNSAVSILQNNYAMALLATSFDFVTLISPHDSSNVLLFGHKGTSIEAFMERINATDIDKEYLLHIVKR